MQKLLIVLETTPTVKEWLDLNGQLIGVTHEGEYLLLANVTPMAREKPKQRHQKAVPMIETNGEIPRRRGRKPRMQASPDQLEVASQS